MTSWQKPTDQQVDLALRKLVQEGQVRYFFDNLHNPEWVQPLAERRFFEKPPEPVRNAEEGTISFPLWAPSRFLARMAEHKPEAVLGVIKKIKQTANTRVLEDLAEALIAMPASEAAKAIDLAKVWASVPYQFVLSEKLSHLVRHLAGSGQSKAALKLAKELFAIKAVKRPIPAPDDSAIELTPEPQANMGTWEYGEGLKITLPALLSAVGVRALVLLTDLLGQVIDAKRSTQGTEDYSYIWRPTIEQSDQNHDNTLEDTLVDAARDTALDLIRSGRASVSTVVATLEAKPQKLFQRLSMHILSVVDAPQDLVAPRLINRESFDDHRLTHEYAQLLEARFHELPQDGKALISDWIDAGPDLNEFRASFEAHRGSKPTADDEQKRIRYWKRDRLAWFGSRMPEELRAKHQQLVSEIEPSETATLPSKHTSWVGPTSPISADDLSRLPVDKVVEYLSGWQPSRDWMSPSREGLSRDLIPVIKAQALAYSSAAEQFIGLSPPYVRAVFAGITDAINEDQEVSWPPVLTLAEWLLKQIDSSEILSSGYDSNEQPWQWVRKSLARLLGTAFKKNRIPMELGPRAFAVLLPLTGDADPTPDHETKFGGSNMEPWTLAVNTTRGEAFHTLIQYALWKLRNGDNKGDRASTFNSMPEVRDVLKRHLDPNNDPSLAIRSVYGQFFPWLVLLDHQWASQNAQRIFPQQEAQAEYFEAAWGGYILFCPPYNNVLNAILPSYSYALDRVGRTSEDFDGAKQADHLASHLVVSYWRGLLQESDGERLWHSFWLKAPPDVRRHALHEIGRALAPLKDAPPEATKRLTTLLDERLLHFETHSNENSEELKEFGWWFPSDVFDPGWALDRLSRVLAITKGVERIREVLTRLVKLADNFPAQTAHCLRLIVEGTPERWGVFLSREPTKELLGRLLKSSDSGARAQAQTAIDLLGARGHLEFRELLKG